MRIYIIAILILISLFSGCTALDDTTVLYATVNITEDETGISLVDVDLDMKKVFPLKVPRQDQYAKTPYMALQAYSNQEIISYLSATEYHGNGTHTFTIPLKKIPQYNDSMTFEIRIFDEASDIGRVYFYSRWRWNETE